jgi:selenocysteine lyase/cysteine desulfurase
MGATAGHLPPDIDPASLRREFPVLADSGLGYLDSAAAAQVPEAVPNALRRFEVEIRANTHEAPRRRCRDTSQSAAHRFRTRWKEFFQPFGSGSGAFLRSNCQTGLMLKQRSIGAYSGVGELP